MVSTFDLDQHRSALSVLHDHICPRQILGLRTGLYGAKLLNIAVPQINKRLIAFIETNGCFADGVAVATGCTVGHRTMYMADYGKVAVTVIDGESGQAIRLTPHVESRHRALRTCPNEDTHWLSYLRAYQVLDDEQLLTAQVVELNFSLEKLISQAGRRVVCDACGEEILNEREVECDGHILCRACAGEAYYSMLPARLTNLR